MKIKSVATLKNIGVTVAARLHELGIITEAQLREVGSAKAYKWLVEHHDEKNMGRHLPVCYYLYSLEGALQNKHWDEFTEKEKTQLRLAAGLAK